ncbi:MAG: hypothetical protein IT211_03545 [Armatimonadetes bacterium]|nr:hypothetical protein [Armatimonadota bacterium]
MNFERLINKYLDGTISSKELQQLQQLLEVPDRMADLRHTLEIRSHIHDDLLRLNPPSPLSEQTRAAVAARFAGLQKPQPIPPIFHNEPKRRRVMLPFRVAAGALVAVWLTTMLALTPTLLWEHQGGGQLTQVAPATPNATQVAADDASRNRSRATRTHKWGRKAPAENQRIAAAVMPTTPAERGSAAASDVELAAAVSDNSAPKTTEQPLPPLADRSPRVSPLGTIPPAALPSSNSESGSGAIAPPPHGIDTPPVAPPPTPGNRLFAVGVTLGSGNVDKLPTPSALMQNTYYFAFSISKETRVGVEMGASTFHQPTGFSGGGNGGFAKGSVGDPTAGAKGPAGPRFSAPIPEETESTQQDPERSVTYGAVFYDRRFPVSRSMDICGRVTVGATDNALLGNLRAYLAYSPSANVTLTAGIGSAGLYTITTNHGQNSLNYGVYYGIETGF